jgi:hypothetical protein
MKWKEKTYFVRNNFYKYFNRFNSNIFEKENNNGICGFPYTHMGNDRNCGVVKSDKKIPSYINIKELIKKLNN